MKYYHYISHSKVDMLFPQIPLEFLSGLKVELGFNFGLLQGKLAGEHPEAATAVARLQAVEKFLEKEYVMQTDVKEQSWLRTKFAARIGFLRSCPGLVLYGGRIDNSVVLLAGSEANLVSGSSNPGNDKGWSFMPRVLDGLKQFVERDLELEYIGGNSNMVAEAAIFGGPTHSDHIMFSALASLPEDSLPEPEFNLSFLARIFLVRTNSHGRSFAIGSPIYVSE